MTTREVCQWCDALPWEPHRNGCPYWGGDVDADRLTWCDGCGRWVDCAPCGCDAGPEESEGL